MTRRYSDRALAKMFERYTEEMLRRSWEACGNTKVKTGARKGQITMRALRWSDVILAEQKRRTGYALFS